MRPERLSFAISLAMATFGIAAAMVLGAKNLFPADIAGLFAHPSDPLAALIWQWRMPRALAAFLVGACLSISGSLFQGTFRNPLAEPYLLGSAAGASLGAAVSLLLPLPLPQAVTLPLFAFAGAWGTTALVLVVARLARITDAASVLLIGVAAGAILAAARSLITLLYSDETTSLRSVVSWMLGGVQTPSPSGLMAFAVLTGGCLVLALALAPGLDALGLGEETAHSMGLRVPRFLALSVMVGALAAGLAVTWGGVVGFVGLVAPHVTRWFAGEMHRPLILHSALLGGGMVALLDGVARSVAAPSEIPLGIVTALVGGPFFLLLLARRRR